MGGEEGEGSTRVLPHGGGVQSAMLAYARARRTRVVQRPVGRGGEEERPEARD